MYDIFYGRSRELRRMKLILLNNFLNEIPLLVILKIIF